MSRDGWIISIIEIFPVKWTAFRSSYRGYMFSSIFNGKYRNNFSIIFGEQKKNEKEMEFNQSLGNASLNQGWTREKKPVVYVSSNSLKCGSKNVIIENQENHTFIFLNAAAAARSVFISIYCSIPISLLLLIFFLRLYYFLYSCSRKFCSPCTSVDGRTQ